MVVENEYSVEPDIVRIGSDRHFAIEIGEVFGAVIHHDFDSVLHAFEVGVRHAGKISVIEGELVNTVAVWNRSEAGTYNQASVAVIGRLEEVESDSNDFRAETVL